MRPDRRAFLVGAIASLVASPAALAADPDFAAVTAPVTALDNGLVSVMKAGKKTPFPERYRMLEPVIVASFDLPRVLQVVVGFGWSSIPESQRKSLLAVFTQYTVASYVANFDTFDGEQFRVLPGLRAVGQLQVVQTEIVRRSKGPVKINFVMRNVGAAWRIVDVLLDGTISQVAVQRSDFSSLLTSGNATALVAALKKKVATLSDHTLT